MKMNLHVKCVAVGSFGTLAVGTLAYFTHKYLKSRKSEDIMEVYFTHDTCEEQHTKNVKYLSISELDFFPRQLTRIVNYINSATKTIDAAVYLFNVKQLGEAMIQAYERGVAVRIVGCSSMQGATGTQFGDLHRHGIPVLFKSTTMCMHHKFCLVDTRDQTEKEKRDSQRRKSRINRSKSKEDQSEKLPTVHIPQNGVCITGSCNWTMQGFSSNWENLIITNNQKILSGFRKEFDRIWSDFIAAQQVTNTDSR
ncbi:mitochondrial cardiolipin hydrolase [Culicoides brevitarsis]|uniref:mitochondrial cardiolipin hydrolase n=1 Tax=Culicoides brevitarsis TaxID=469753 RepID=UPI00307CC60B